MKLNYLLPGVFLMILYLAGCAMTPRVEVARDPGADFSGYSTFGFHQPLGTDRETGTGTVLSQLLRQQTRAELESRGYRYVEASPDLEINFFVETREKVESIREPGWSMRYGGWYTRYGVWADYDTQRIRQYTEGTLHVDVVDVARNQLIWEAVAQERLPASDFSYIREEVRKALTEIFVRFPARASRPE